MGDTEIASYLGSRGYTIKKENLDVDEIILIKKELMVEAFVPKTSLAKPTPFPVFRESTSKLYF